MSFEVTRQELLKQAIALNKLWLSTRNQEYKDQETRIRRIVADLEIFSAGGSGVTQIIPGTNVTVSPSGGTGAVTINSTNPLPVGGTDGQILAKIDGVDYNTEWIDNYTSQVKHEVKLGENMTKGTPVYVSASTGGSGTNMIVSKASNTSEATSSKTMGLIATGGVTNDFVFVVTEGLLSGLDTSTAVAGDLVWLGPSGTLLFGLANKPVAPAHMVFLGIVTRVQSVNGEIFVKVQNGFEIEELHNVAIGTKTNNDLLVYESSTSLWKNKQISSVLSDGMLKVASAISTTFQVVKDYLDNVSVLFLNSRRVGIGKDTSVTTQSVAVVEVQDANTSIVLKPNGTGGIIASVPDGTATGGNARGNGSVDLQMSRSSADRVASGVRSFVFGRNSSATSAAYGSYTFGENCNNSGQASSLMGGESNTVTASVSFLGGGISNSISATRGTIAGGDTNTVSSTYSTISGGQSNTASTNTHATVVGGQSNTASGQWSLAGGQSSVASGTRSVALGAVATASAQQSFAFGLNTTVQGYGSVGIGHYAQTGTSADLAFASGSGRSYLYNQMSHGNYWFTDGGNANFGSRQLSQLLPYRESALTTGATMLLSLDGTGTTNLIIPLGNNRAWNVQIDTIAVVTAITGTATGVSVGDTYEEKATMSFKKVGGTSSLVALGSRQQIYDTSMATAIMNFSAGASQQLQIQFQAPTFAGGGSITCRVVSKVMLVEVAY